MAKSSRLKFHMLGMALPLALSVPASAEENDETTISSVLELANILYSEAKFDDARREFERAIELDKGSLPAWRGLGWSYWSIGQRDHAFKIWTDLIKAFPDDLSTLLALAKASEQDKHWNEAADYYARIITLQPNNQAAHLGRSRIFVTQHEFVLAEQEAKAVLEDAPTDSAAKSLLIDALMGQSRYQEAEDWLRQLTQAEHVPHNLRRLGKTMAELGQYEQAADIFKTSLNIEADEDTLSAWRNLGASLRKQGQNQRAYAIWQGILQVAPTDTPTLLALGRASEQDQLWQQGLEYYGRILQKTPNHRSAQMGRAKILAAEHNFSAAETELQSILSHSPDDVDAQAMLIENMVAMGRSDEAIQMLKPIVNADPTPKNLSRLGTLLTDAGRSDEAATYFDKCLQLDPENSTAVIGLAQSYWNQHDYNQSINLLQSYLTAHPDNETVHTRLAEHASAADDWELAEHEWRTLADLHPEEIKWQLKLATLLHRSGQHAEAIKIASALINSDPNNETALKLLADDALFAEDIKNAIFWTQRLTTLTPTMDRLTRLGRLYMQLGEQLEAAGDHNAAVLQYGMALQAFNDTAALDPIRFGVPVDMVKALRLLGRQEEAMILSQKLYEQYPNSRDVIRQLAVSYREMGDYPAARDTLAHNEPFFKNSPALLQDMAELTYYAGQHERAFKMLNDELKTPNHPAIPVLLYHGITLSDRQDTVPLQKFREQLLALKQAGYQTISIPEFLGFLEGRTTLPPKPILITFDDARSDSFKYADPVLAETGFKATMFVPVGDVARHQPYAAVWPIIKNMFDTGRWDMQCHGTNAQHNVAVNTEGHLGHFLANRMWIPDAARLETNAEFAGRIEQDMLTCKETLAHEVPGANIVAFAFPYGDQGHRSLSNTQEAFNINQAAVKKQFSLAFNVDNNDLVTTTTPRYSLPRFEVPRSFSGQDLVLQLKKIDPELSTAHTLAHLDVESGRYGEALEIMDSLTQSGSFDNTELLTTSGKVLGWSGDHAGARNRLNQALALRPNDPLIQKEIDELNTRIQPKVDISGLYFQDNAHRSYYSLSPSSQYAVSDSLSVSAYYKYLDFSQTLTHSTPDPMIGQEHYQAIGNQFGGQFNYELAARSLLSMSAGFADFSGLASLEPEKSASTFVLGAAKLTAGLGDRLDLSIAADHTYVNTAGAIMNDLAFNRVEGEFKFKLLDSLSLRASNAYFNYTDNNQRNRTEVELYKTLWGNPDITVGAQFIRDDTQKNNPLFWTSNNYLAFSAPLSFKKKWAGDKLITELNVAPGMGKEADSDFKFQINGHGNLSWKVKDNLTLNVSLNRYQAATYSSFSVFGGINVNF